MFYSSSTTTSCKRLHYIFAEERNSGLFPFDDCPENYLAWKTSFWAITSELNIASREEIDFLVKWLAPDSSSHAKRIKSVHVSDPALGDCMIWRHLEDCYGCPEVRAGDVKET